MKESVDFEKNKKSKTWIWVVAAVAVLCLCCLAAVVVLGILYWTPIKAYLSTAVTNGIPGSSAVPTVAPYTPPASGNRPAPPTSVTVEPVNPDSIPLGVYSLYDITPNWEGLSQPGENTWQVTFPYDQAIVLFTGWCTQSQDILEQNFEHISFKLEVDGKNIPVDGLYWQDAPGNGGFCRSYFGIVQAWPTGSHTVVQTMTFDESINDGWGDYLAGDYVDQFDITATP
jgi:hypothetical protein